VIWLGLKSETDFGKTSHSTVDKKHTASRNCKMQIDVATVFGVTLNDGFLATMVAYNTLA